MKRIITLSLSVLALGIAACSPTNTTSTSSANASSASTATSTPAAENQAIVTLTHDGVAVEGSPYTFTFETGATLMEVLQANLDIEESDGFITSINGLSQDATTNHYWLFNVNGKQSPVGASQDILKSGDVVDFQLEAIN